MNEEEEQLQGPVLIQGSLRAALRSSRQTSSLDIVLMATAQQGVIDPEVCSHYFLLWILCIDGN